MSPIKQHLLSVLLLSSSFLAIPAVAQKPVPSPVPQADRVTAQPNLRINTRLAGHTPAWAIPANDAGVVSQETILRLTFVLARSAERQAAFEQRLADQQNPSSASYHHWLTPRQIGSFYGPSQHDIAALTTWLTAQGFSILDVAPSAVFVTAQAPASTVASALAVSFHLYNLSDPDSPGAFKPRIAATTNPAIPSAFAPIIISIDGLSENPAYPMHQSQSITVPASGGSSRYTPQGTDATPSGTGGSGSHYLSPNDFNLIYDLQSLFSAGFNGAGQKIAIIGRSRVLADDITNFEAITGLASSQPNTIIPTTGVDPGITGTSVQSEATLDVQRVLGTAPGAQADLVVSKSSSTQDGIAIAAQYEVSTLVDPIMNISFGSCETSNGIAGVTFWSNLFATAAAEGITTFVSSGDSAAASCQTAFAAPVGVQSRSINVICSSSYVTCVGGTEFADFASPTTYWAASNSTGLRSALSYIPEGAWNEPSTTSAATGATTYVVQGTGGGASAFVSKPTWQVGAGVPADGFRDVPDVSFSASGHDGYIACLTLTPPATQCILNANGGFNASLFAGTSAAAPSMASIAALLNQKLGAAQGNINPLLYRLASTAPNAFHDATPASSGVGCDLNTPSMCNNSTPSATALTGGLAGFALTTGYDQATGLGSLDGASFVSAAAGTVLADTATTLTAAPASVAINGSVVFTASVAPIKTSATAPTGNVQFYEGSAAFGPVVPLGSGKATLTTTAASANSGVFAITAQYAGDTNYLSSTSAATNLTVLGPVGLLGLTPAATKLSFAAGATTGNTDALAIASFNYTGLVSLACGVIYNGTGTSTFLPTCSLAPASLTLASNGSGTSLLTISSTVPHLLQGGTTTAANHPPNRTPANPRSTSGRIALCSLFVLALLPIRRRGRRTVRALRSWQSLPVALLLLCGLGTLAACSGSSTPASPNPLLTSGTNTTITPAVSTLSSGNSTTFAATVVNAGFNTTATPSGTVQFFQNGSTPLGSATLAAGKATSPAVTFATAGTFNITAQYSGDTNFSASTSNATPIVITPVGTTTGSYTVIVTATGTNGVSTTSAIALTIQ